MFEVKTKLRSIELIKKLELNQFPEQLFHSGEEGKIEIFLEKYPAKYYAVRSKKIVGCKKNNFKVPRDKVLEEQKKFDLFSINVSSYNYSSHLILIGDIKISKNNEVWLIATTNQEFTGKMAEQNPEFNLKTTIFDKGLNKIPKFDEIYQYVANHKLMDVIVEFAYYDIPVGIHNQNIIIFEIRTHF